MVIDKLEYNISTETYLKKKKRGILSSNSILDIAPAHTVSHFTLTLLMLRKKQQTVRLWITMAKANYTITIKLNTIHHDYRYVHALRQKLPVGFYYRRQSPDFNLQTCGKGRQQSRAAYEWLTFQEN